MHASESKLKISSLALPHMRFFHKKAQTIPILTIIETVLALLLIGWAAWFFGSMYGMFGNDENMAAQASFDSLVAKINQLINDPRPLAYTTMPYYLGDTYSVAGYRRSGVKYRTCGVEQIEQNLGYPSSGQWAPVCAEPNCICLERGPSREFVKCTSTRNYDLYFSLVETPQENSFRNTARGSLIGAARFPDYLTPYEYGSLRDLVLLSGRQSGCTDIETVFPLYIEKHNLITKENGNIVEKKILYFTYGGSQQKINERLTNQVRRSIAVHVRLADESSDIQEKIRLMQRLKQYNLNSDQQIIVLTKLCDYATQAPDWRLSANYCSDLLARFAYEVYPEIYEPAYVNYATALVQTNNLVQLTQELVDDGGKIFTATNSPENKRILSYTLGSYFLLKAFDTRVAPAEQVLFARRASYYYDFFLQSPNEKYFIANRNMIELVNKLEGNQKAGEFADSKITEYRNVLETLRVRGGYPPEIEPRYKILDASYGQALTQQKINRISEDVEAEIQYFEQRKTALQPQVA
ncbi:MAG: hypothetical protein HY363_04500 [Candidatus Aenigmarchaeota archaeon]|nr:hypothetical protein [Candidatus Aenigmarchaeota archaeon]